VQQQCTNPVYLCYSKQRIWQLLNGVQMSAVHAIACGLTEWLSAVEIPDLSACVVNCTMMLLYVVIVKGNTAIPCSLFPKSICGINSTFLCLRMTIYRKVPVLRAFWSCNTPRVGQNHIYYVCTVYDRVFGDFPAKNTVYTPYKYGSGHP